ncbi:hypothetical protein ZWY2020_059709 [Hordeum vulgare]|nr:hypothetical protein ZWY2020_059709 [Hordeum vulgare]
MHGATTIMGARAGAFDGRVRVGMGALDDGAVVGSTGRAGDGSTGGTAHGDVGVDTGGLDGAVAGTAAAFSWNDDLTTPRGGGIGLDLRDKRESGGAEIFLRLTAPADLAACVSFRGVITGHPFLRRFRTLHPPPLLGILCDGLIPAQPPHPSAAAAATLADADFSCSFLPPSRDRWCRLDGRALFTPASRGAASCATARTTPGIWSRSSPSATRCTAATSCYLSSPTTSPVKSIRRSSWNRLQDELLGEIFLRLPTAADLARASTACVSFRRVVAGHPFLLRFRALHPPPLIGIFCGNLTPAQPPHPSAAATSILVDADFSCSFIHPSRDR